MALDEAGAPALTGLSRLLAPRRIAFVGGRECAVAIEQCRRAGFAGAIEAVHPRREDLAGVPCVRSVEDLSAPPDAVFLAVPPEATVGTAARLSAMGAGGAVCYAAGFAEAGPHGAALQQALLEAAGAMPVLGPNCYGLLNYLDGAALWPDVHGGERVARGVGLISQSSNLAINLTMQRRGLPIAYVATVGNAARVGVADLIEAYAADPRVSAVGVYLESLGGAPHRFAAAVRSAQAAGKPVVAFKTGRSEAGARATLSHTSSLAGGAAAFDAFLDGLDVPQAFSVPAFLEALKLLHVLGPLPGARLVSMSCSGGEAALVADAAARLGVETPSLDAEASRLLSAVLGPKVAIDNPLDYHTYIWLDGEACRACYTAALGAPTADVGMLVLDYPKDGAGDATGWDLATDALIAAAQATGRPALVAATLPECLPEGPRARLMQAGVAPMQGIEEALFAIRAAAVAGRARPGVAPSPVAPPAVLRDGPARTLDEWRAKKRLAAWGLSAPEGALVTDATEAAAAAEALGYPVAVKIVSAALAHKSEVGGVRLGLGDADAVVAAVDALSATGERFLVERMVTDGVAELILGVTRDPQIGLCVMIGAGGVLTELLADRAVLPLPTDAAAVERALDGLRIARLLTGYRGRPPADRAAAVAAALAVADFATAHADRLLELDVNPLIVRPEGLGAIAADALIRWIEEGEDG
ncbi:MAG: acetate--CoA ligase family protein [Alphaproteobacteria bacterium]|nr:acetate--CoA ligase family protein [Alphaproteobacteria bacterium]